MFSRGVPGEEEVLKVKSCFTVYDFSLEQITGKKPSFLKNIGTNFLR
jgi:hypothetical protein